MWIRKALKKPNEVFTKITVPRESVLVTEQQEPGSLMVLCTTSMSIRA